MTAVAACISTANEMQVATNQRRHHHHQHAKADRLHGVSNITETQSYKTFSSPLAQVPKFIQGRRQP